MHPKAKHQEPTTKRQGPRAKDLHAGAMQLHAGAKVQEQGDQEPNEQVYIRKTIMHAKDREPRAKRQGPGAKDQDPRTLQELRTKSHCKDPAGTMDQEPWSRGQGNIGEVIQYKLALYM